MTKTGRKFLMAMFILIFAALMEFINGGISEEFIYLASLVLGIYSTGNVGATFVHKREPKP